MNLFYKLGGILLFMLIVALSISSCSKYDKEDLHGTWTATTPFPQEELDGMYARQKNNVNQSFSDIEMILTISRDENFILTTDFEYTRITKGEAVTSVLNHSIRQEIKGWWSFFSDDLSLVMEETDVYPRDETTAESFKKNPNYREAWMPSATGLFSATQWNVIEAVSDILVFDTDEFGKVQFERYNR